MKTTIDRAGRIVIPREVRAAAGLQPGTAVEVVSRNGIVTIEPAASAVKIVKRGRLRVAVPDDERQSLTDNEVRATRDRVRQ